MSCNYADGLSPYHHKGVLGVAEKFDTSETLKEKCSILAEYLKNAKHVVVHTGAGISTSAGIPDFRGPNGVWTLEEKGLKPTINISFKEAKPTKTHMALKCLMEKGYIHFIVSQNIDGLHLKSGLQREHLAELHGNMFIEQCNVCKRQFVRSSPAPTVGQRSLEIPCHGGKSSGRPCRGKLHDVILDWEHSLPDDDLDMSDMHSCIADLSICLGTTLQIIPSGNLPLNSVKYGGKLVICNLQPTKHDNKADLVINAYVDDVLEYLMKSLDLEIPEYQNEMDPTQAINGKLSEWTVSKKLINSIKLLFKKKCDGVPRKRVLIKRERNKQLDTKSAKAIKKVKTVERKKYPKNDTINIVKQEIKEEDVKEIKQEDVKEIKQEDVIEIKQDLNECKSKDITEDDIKKES